MPKNFDKPTSVTDIENYSDYVRENIKAVATMNYDGIEADGSIPTNAIKPRNGTFHVFDGTNWNEMNPLGWSLKAKTLSNNNDPIPGYRNFPNGLQSKGNNVEGTPVFVQNRANNGNPNIDNSYLDLDKNHASTLGWHTFTTSDFPALGYIPVTAKWIHLYWNLSVGWDSNGFDPSASDFNFYVYFGINKTAQSSTGFENEKFRRYVGASVNDVVRYNGEITIPVSNRSFSVYFKSENRPELFTQLRIDGYGW